MARVVGDPGLVSWLTPARRHTYYGGSGCFVFSLRPRVEVRANFGRAERGRSRLCPQICWPRRGAGARRDFMYLNTKGRHKGICIGSSGDPASARIAIPEQLGDATVTARRSCLTFESGDLAPSALQGNVDIDAIEVWGVGDQDLIEAAAKGRDESRQLRADHVRKAGTVDKYKFLENSFDREHILCKTFAGCRREVRP